MTGPSVAPNSFLRNLDVGCIHKTVNVFNTLPKSVQPKAKRFLHDVWQTGTLQDAQHSFDQLIVTYEPNYPEVMACLIKDGDRLIAFYAHAAGND